MKNKCFASIIAMGISLGIQAQNAANNEATASVMRSNGKIYVVVAVLTTILMGLIVYVINIDRKISKLEKES